MTTPLPDAAPRSRRRSRSLGPVLLGAALGLLIPVFTLDVRYAHLPALERVRNRERLPAHAYDLWGRAIDADDAQQLLATESGRSLLSPANGAVRIDDDLLRLGREVFYTHSFRSEYYATDVLGALDGPLTPGAFARAVAAQAVRGTENLRVRLARDATVGGRRFRRGQIVDTGLDLPRGALAPLGISVRYTRGKIRMGITCALCHAAYDQASGTIVEGAINRDIDMGLMMALASNSAAYFTHAQPGPMEQYLTDHSRTVTGANGSPVPLPDPRALEDAVDRDFLSWPRGWFDSTIDLVANPTDIPDAFTWGDHPFGWSGFAMAGPFRGLSVFSNNVHAQNSDTTSQAPSAPTLFGLDPEQYLGIILQNAPNARIRVRPGDRPSAVMTRLDPEPWTIGYNQLVAPPSFPRISLVAPDGMFLSTPGYPFYQQLNAVAAWQDTLLPPPPPAELATADGAVIAHGRDVFQAAGCAACHAGPALTDNRVRAVTEVGTEPSRAPAFRATQKVWADPPSMWAFDAPVPLPPGTRANPVPTDHLDPEQIDLAWGHNGSPGGYKTPSLIGLSYSAPYLHDGGVSVGPDPAQDLGVPGTALKATPPHPAHSLRALIDRDLRQQVLDANHRAELDHLHITGQGHAHWVDAGSGFTPADQEALIAYLLTYRPPPTPSPHVSAPPRSPAPGTPGSSPPSR